MGRAMLKFMNLCHAPLTNWGLKLVDIQDGWTMLDIGCGGGATLQRLLKRSQEAQVYGIDISEESVAKAKKVNAKVLDKQVFVTQGSAEKLPYEDGKFDLVTAVETVYFWPNLPSCLQEVRRVLKSGGKFAIMVEVVDGDSMWTNVVEGMTFARGIEDHARRCRLHPNRNPPHETIERNYHRSERLLIPVPDSSRSMSPPSSTLSLTSYIIHHTSSLFHLSS